MAASTVHTLEADGIVTVEFDPNTNLDAETVQNIQKQLYALVEGSQARKVLLDFANVAFMSSLAMGCMLTLRLKAARSGSRLIISGIRETLTDILEMTQMDKLFEIVPTREEARKRLLA